MDIGFNWKGVMLEWKGKKKMVGSNFKQELNIVKLLLNEFV